MRAGDAEFRPLEIQGCQLLDEIIGGVTVSSLVTLSACLRMKRAELPTPHMAAYLTSVLMVAGPGTPTWIGSLMPLSLQHGWPNRPPAPPRKELRGDIARACCREIGLLLLQRLDKRGFALSLGDIGIAFGMAGDADARHAIGLEQPVSSNWMAASNLPMGAARRRPGPASA